MVAQISNAQNEVPHQNKPPSKKSGRKKSTSKKSASKMAPKSQLAPRKSKKGAANKSPTSKPPSPSPKALPDVIDHHDRKDYMNAPSPRTNGDMPDASTGTISEDSEDEDDIQPQPLLSKPPTPSDKIIPSPGGTETQKSAERAASLQPPSSPAAVFGNSINLLGSALNQVGTLLPHNNTAQHTEKLLLKDILACLEHSNEETERRNESMEPILESAVQDQNNNMARLLAAFQSNGQRTEKSIRQERKLKN